MGWNHRVIKTTSGDEVSFGIHEVYYDDTGKPGMATEEAVGIVADTYEELWMVMRDVSQALFLPALEWKDGELVEVVK